MLTARADAKPTRQTRLYLSGRRLIHGNRVSTELWAPDDSKKRKREEGTSCHNWRRVPGSSPFAEDEPAHKAVKYKHTSSVGFGGKPEPCESDCLSRRLHANWLLKRPWPNNKPADR